MNSAKTVNDMDKAEYNLAMYHCRLTCEPQKEKCKDCELLKIYREIYDNGQDREDTPENQRT